MFFSYAVNDEAAPWMQSMFWSFQEYAVHDGAAVSDARILYGVGTTKFGNISTKVGSTETGDVSGIINKDRNRPKGLAEVEACPVGG